MYIVHIYKDYPPVLGGIENCVQWFAEAFVARGHDVSVLVTALDAHTTENIENGVHVIRTGRQISVQSTPLSLAMPAWLARLTQGADIAHVHVPFPPGEALNMWGGKARYTVLHWHSDVVRQKSLLRIYGPLLRRVVACADHIIPTSDAYMHTSPWISPYAGKCTAIPYGIDPAMFAPDPEGRLRVREKFKVSDKFVLLSLGRLRYYKGLDDLIRALPALPDDCVALIGGVGPMLADWQALAQQLGVANRVIFAGDVSAADLTAFYSAGDCYAIPANSRAEAFGIAILEAMACGLPILSTEVGTATSWINQHEVTGLVVPPQAPGELAAAALRLHSDSALRARFGSAARQRVRTNFTRELMIDRLAAVYEAVAAG